MTDLLLPALDGLGTTSFTSTRPTPYLELDVRFHCAGAYTATYSTVGFNGFAPLTTVVR